jgi:hypothetical protein
MALFIPCSVSVAIFVLPALSEIPAMALMRSRISISEPKSKI